MKDVWLNGIWNFDVLYTLIPEDKKSMMLLITPMLAEGVANIWTWRHHMSGIHSGCAVSVLGLALEAASTS